MIGFKMQSLFNTPVRGKSRSKARSRFAMQATVGLALVCLGAIGSVTAMVNRASAAGPCCQLGVEGGLARPTVGSFQEAASVASPYPPQINGFVNGKRPSEQEFVDAEEAVTDADGELSVEGDLDAEVTKRVYKVVPRQTGLATIDLASDDFDTELYVFDDSRIQIGTNDDGPDGTNSQLKLRFVEGRHYFVVATSLSGAPVADFELKVFVDPTADPIAMAEVLRLDDDADGEAVGNLADETSTRLFVITPGFDGQLVVRNEATDGGLDCYLRVYDDEFRIMGENDDEPSGGTTDSQVMIRVREGSSYLVEASPFSGTGGFRVRVDGMPGVDPLEEAIGLELDDDGKGVAEARLLVGTEKKLFSFEAPVTGEMTILMESSGANQFDTFLQIYDEDFRSLGQNDDAPQMGTNSAVTSFFREGSTYVIEASSYSSTPGDFFLRVVPGGMPSPFDDATDIELNEAGKAAIRGEIGGFSMANVYILTAPEFSDITITLRKGMSSDLDPLLTIFNDSRVAIASNDDAFEDNYDAQITFRARAGNTYYIRTAPSGETVGTYLLTASSKRARNPIDVATTIVLDGEEGAETTGEIDVIGKELGFKFELPSGGEWSVMASRGGGAIDPNLAIYDADKELVGRNQNVYEFSTDAGLTIEGDEGDIFYALAGASTDVQGELVIKVFAGGIPSPFESSASFELDDEGKATFEGEVDGTEAGVIYQFVAPEDGPMTVTHSAIDNNIDTLLTVYDSDEEMIGYNDDGVDGTTNSMLIFDTEAGETYYIRAAAFAGNIGEFRVEVMVGRPPSPFTNAITIEIDEDGTAAEEGEIEGASAYYQFVSPVTGMLIVEQRAGPDSGVDTVLTAYNANEEQVAYNDDGIDGTLDSRLELAVSEGQTYYLQAGSLGGENGAYSLSIRMGVDPFDAAEEIELNEEGTFQVADELTDGNLKKVFILSPEETGDYIIAHITGEDSSLDPELTIFNESREQIGYNDDSPDLGLSSKLELRLEAGQSYYIAAGSLNGGGGEFVLYVTNGEFDPDGASKEMMADGDELEFDGDGNVEVVGELSEDEDELYYSFVAEHTGKVTISMIADDVTELDTYLDVYDEDGEELAANDDAGDTNSQVELDVVRGERYIVRATAYSSGTGRFTIKIER